MTPALDAKFAHTNKFALLGDTNDDNKEDAENRPVWHATTNKDNVKDNNDAGAYSAHINKYISEDEEASAYSAIINRFAPLPVENKDSNVTNTEQAIHIGLTLPVLDHSTGKTLEHCQLCKHLVYKQTWDRSYTNKLGQLCQGI
jgi:hypothetical protein